MFARLIDEAAARLTSTGARLVMMTVAPPSPSEGYPDPPKDPKFEHMNRLLREYARSHADRTSVVDLARLLCPNGTQPCPEEVSGVRPRPRDGNHFEPDTAGWVARQLMPQVMAASPGSGIDAATPAEATTNASVGKREVDPGGRGERLGLRPHPGLHRGEAVTVEERCRRSTIVRHAARSCVVVRPVAVFVRVLELVEGGVLGVEQLAVPPEESFVDHAVPVRSCDPLASVRHCRRRCRVPRRPYRGPAVSRSRLGERRRAPRRRVKRPS